MTAGLLQRTYARFTLDNGLRLIVVPETSPLVTVAVHYGVGWRDEAPDRSGFAHLFEHLMFEGSPGLPRGAYRERVNALGGQFTAFTRADFTAYWSQVPAESLAEDLAIEADRMRGITADAAALGNQVSVVEEEIRVNIRNRPYGGFPFFDVPPVLFTSHANTHDGYGDFDGLRRSTLEEVAEFFDRYYCPANALVTVVGPAEPDDVLALVEAAFGGIEHRPTPAPLDLREPALREPRWERRTDPLAPLPAVALGFRVPDPADFDDYLAAYLVDRLLTAGESARLREVLVRREQVAHEVVGWFGYIDQPFTTRDPSLDSIAIHHSGDLDRVLALVEGVLSELAEAGPSPEALRRTQAAEVTRYWTALDQQILRALQVGALEAVHGRAELFEQLPDLLSAVTPDRVRDVAARFYAGPGRAVVEVEAGAA